MIGVQQTASSGPSVSPTLLFSSNIFANGDCVADRNFYDTAAFSPNFWRSSDKRLVMVETTVIQADISEPSISGASWGAILAGGVATAALTFVVLSLGVGLGLSVVSPWGNSGVSATTVKIGTGLYLIVVAMLSSSIGGYLAGRLRTRSIGAHTNEVYFRDTAHGFLSWAFAMLLGFVVLATPAGNILGGATSGISQAVTTNATQSGPADGYVDALLRTDGSSSQAAGNPDNARSELVRLFTANVMKGGDLNAPDLSYVAKVVATRTGLSQADAEKRVSDVITQAKTDLDNARKAAAQLAFWLTASLLIGAFCASLAATEGGSLRDRS
jgi:hypothetical protein